MCAISFLKFSHCEGTNWATPDQYIHACYSDLPSLYEARGLSNHRWAYIGGENAIEYPVITGIIMWATSWLAHSPSGYFNLNAIFIGILFIGSIFLVRKMAPHRFNLYLISPAVIASLYINWDLWAVVTMLAAIYYFDKEKYKESSIYLGISIATKFMPIFLLLPITIILWRRNKKREIITYSLISFGTWLIINIPVAITTPDGWWRFYQLNLQRGPDWGSIWYTLSIFSISIENLNYISVLILLAVFTGISIFLLEPRNAPTLAQVAFIVLASVMVISKVYSPQYVLWLTPLAVIALKERNTLSAYWIWQITELLYHVAIWQHLATVTGSTFGLPATTYGVLAAIRILATVYLIATFIRQSLADKRSKEGSSGNNLADFLFEAGKSYP